MTKSVKNNGQWILIGILIIGMIFSTTLTPAYGGAFGDELPETATEQPPGGIPASTDCNECAILKEISKDVKNNNAWLQHINNRVGKVEYRLERVEKVALETRGNTEETNAILGKVFKGVIPEDGTLGELCKKNNWSLIAVIGFNGIENPDVVYEGQTFQYPQTSEEMAEAMRKGRPLHAAWLAKQKPTMVADIQSSQTDLGKFTAESVAVSGDITARQILTDRFAANQVDVGRISAGTLDVGTVGAVRQRRQLAASGNCSQGCNVTVNVNVGAPASAVWSGTESGAAASGGNCGPAGCFHGLKPGQVRVGQYDPTSPCSPLPGTVTPTR